jgi:hypothetical protein
VLAETDKIGLYKVSEFIPRVHRGEDLREFFAS